MMGISRRPGKGRRGRSAFRQRNQLVVAGHRIEAAGLPVGLGGVDAVLARGGRGPFRVTARGQPVQKPTAAVLASSIMIPQS
jgi:hypothetical protein